jgi:hypothetical protein
MIENDEEMADRITELSIRLITFLTEDVERDPSVVHTALASTLGSGIAACTIPGRENEVVAHVISLIRGMVDRGDGAGQMVH